MPLNVLVVGAGVGGPALALMLQHTNVNAAVTVIERYPSLRTGGQQIDVKSQAVPVMRKLDLLGVLRSRCVDETGMDVVNSDGKPVVQFGITSADGKKGVGMTQEYEIMRGDLVGLLHEASLERHADKLKGWKGVEKLGKLTYEFGKSVTELTQSDNGVDVVLSTGERRRYDLVIASDGQNSRTRRLAFGQMVSDAAFSPFGMQVAFYSIPKTKDDKDDTRAKIYWESGRRALMTRANHREVVQVGLLTMRNHQPHLTKRPKGRPVEAQMQAWTEMFAGSGWQGDRLLKGMQDSEDFYAAECGKTKMEQLFTGRVALLGEAGYGGTLTGVGTELAIVGAYVLAGELARHGEDDVEGALKAYERVMQGPIKEWVITISTWLVGCFLPASRWGIWILHTCMWLFSKIAPLVMRMQSENKGGWKLPEYPELERMEQ